ncbi:hypothetical protein ACP70R_023043 [Stipagrostis hirtigluma subsp. patula]
MAPHSSSSSAAMRSIRRELQRRRPKPLAPKKPAAKKPSAPPSGGARDPGRVPPPRPRQDPSPRFVTSLSRGTTVVPPPRRPPPRPHASTRSSPVASPSTTPPLPRPAASCSVAPAFAAETLRPGTEVLVRTRTATLRTGQVLVLWLSAVVVSAPDGGYEIVYNGKWPRGNPHALVHVARDHVKLPKLPRMPPPPKSKLPPSAASSRASAVTALAAAPKKEMKPVPRPTTAGKSLRLVHKLWPEMELQPRAPLSGY